MAEELGVVGCGDDGAYRGALSCPGNLGGASSDKVASMLGDSGHRGLRVVGLFLGLGTRGDAVILEPRVHADAVGVDEGGHLLERPVEAHIAVVLAVAEIAGVALVRRPDLARRLGVAPEEGDAAWREQRCNEPAQRPVGGTLDGVAIDKREAHAGLCEETVHASSVGAFAHPHAGGGEAAARLEGACSGANLAAPAAIEEHERQEAMRANAGDELDAPALVQPDETADEVALKPVQVEVAEPDEAGEVEAGHGAERCVGLGPGDLLRRQPDEAGEVRFEAVAEEPVVEHADERLREREGDAAGDAIAVEPLQHFDERQVGLEDGLKEPVLLEVVGVLGVPNEGEVGVEDNLERAVHERLQLFPGLVVSEVVRADRDAACRCEPALLRGGR